MRFSRLSVLMTATLFGAAVCACEEQGAAPDRDSVQQAQEQAPTPPYQLRVGCPMAVGGADVAVSDTDAGVALTFTTDAGDVEDLRERVRHMASMYEMHRGHRGMMWHHMGGQGRGPAGRGMGRGPMGGGRGMPPVSTTVTDVESGARLELRPTDASQLDALREHVRWHQQRMQSGECWMLQQDAAAPAPDTDE